MLQVKSLSVSYGSISVLKQLNLEVKAGELVALIGANGAGKTTLLLALSGIIASSSGEIVFNSEEISTLPAESRVARGLAHVPEGRKIFSRLTVAENLELGGYLRQQDQHFKEDLDKVHQLFPILAERRKQSAGTLSGGEQQMLAIGRALMSKPKLLLLDEPSMGIAPLLTERIFQTIKQLHNHGMTMLLVEQNARLALQTADRAYVLETGSISISGAANALMNDPRITKAYLGM